MKRIKAACIMQTIRFQQKEGSGFSVNVLLDMNRAEAERYKQQLDRTRTRYKIEEQTEEPDGTVIIRIRKEYNSRTEIGAYFD